MAESGAISASRRLLQRLRDLMASTGEVQQRLDQVVKLIAGNMVAEVCSVYVMRAGEVLELFASEGLKAEAVHLTRLQLGEGIVGDIAGRARPLALSDAQSHPNFAYRPETGEEIYQSLMGVPILRGGRVMGVLVIQNRTSRAYTEEEVETLQTIAMVLAELVAGGELVSPDELAPAGSHPASPMRLTGVAFNAGIAIGRAVMHQPRAIAHRMVAEDADAELQRFAAALEGMHTAIDDLIAATDLAMPGEHREVLETFRLIAEDRGWIGRIREAIRGGLTAEAAVQRVQDDTRARMGQISDPYIRERLADFEDLTNRLLLHLTGGNGEGMGSAGELPDDIVLVSRSMGPAELLDYDRSRLRAVLLEEGAVHSHVSIVARALDIPMIGRMSGALDRVEAGDTVIVDGDNATAFVRPGEDVQAAFVQSMAAAKRRREAYAALRDRPAVTRDGVAISLNINAGLLVDVQHLDDTGAEGVGLYRTEIPFMVRPSFPGVDDQVEIYARALKVAGKRPIVFRTLDVGGDKVLPYVPGQEEENPAMGWRAIRIALDRPAILRQQLRAMIRAARGRDLHVMFPMVAEVAEFDAAREIVVREIERAQSGRGRGGRGKVPRSVKIGVMLEVPALLFQLPALLQRVDFVSVGSNDLLQFLFASDRGNPRIAERYDVLAPAVLTLLRGLAAKCQAAGVPLTLCGEMGGRPLEAMALIGLGIRRFSMAPVALGPVKAMILSLDAGALAEYMAGLDETAAHSLRPKLRFFAKDHGVVI